MNHSPLLAALALSLGIHGLILLFPEEVGDVRLIAEKTREVGLVYIAAPAAPPPQPLPAPSRPTPAPTPPEAKASRKSAPPKTTAKENPRRTAITENIPQQVALEEDSPPEEPAPPHASSPPAQAPAMEPAAAGVPSPPRPQGQSSQQTEKAAPSAAAAVANTLQPPRYRFNPRPEYPGLATRRRWQGEVLLRALVDAQGDVARVEVESSSGHDILDQAALKTVRRWKFHPAHDGEQNVSGEVCLPIRFELTNP